MELRWALEKNARANRLDFTTNFGMHGHCTVSSKMKHGVTFGVSALVPMEVYFMRSEWTDEDRVELRTWLEEVFEFHNLGNALNRLVLADALADRFNAIFVESGVVLQRWEDEIWSNGAVYTFADGEDMYQHKWRRDLGTFERICHTHSREALTRW